jgi:LuxR family maltose regulon positive regulatory protein
MGALERPAKTRIVMLSALCWLAIDTGRLRIVAPLVDEMVTLLGKADRIDLWYHTTPPHRLPGLPGVARPLARHAAALLRVAGDDPTPLRALALFSQAWCAMWEGRLPAAYALRERARDDARWCGDPNVLRGHFLALTATLEAVAGRPDAAMEAAFARVRLLGGDLPWPRYIVLLFAGRIASTCSHLQALRDIVPQLDALKRQMPSSDLAARTRSQLPVEARLAWLEGRPEIAIATWREALAHEEEIDFLGQAVQTRCRLALALAQAGDVDEAAMVVKPVFTRVDGEGAPGAALLATDALRDLAAVEWGGALDARQRSTLGAWWRIVADERSRQGPQPADAVPGRVHAVPVDSTLTARELEVLGRIAAGDSNKHIARALDLSLHTVKRHVANILGKLDVETRGQAAAWYRAR